MCFIKDSTRVLPLAYLLFTVFSAAKTILLLILPKLLLIDRSTPESGATVKVPLPCNYSQGPTNPKMKLKFKSEKLACSFYPPTSATQTTSLFHLRILCLNHQTSVFLTLHPNRLIKTQVHQIVLNQIPSLFSLYC